MLRAHMPAKFKTPGSGQPLVSGNNNNTLIITAAERDKLVALRQEALRAMQPKQIGNSGQMAAITGQVVEEASLTKIDNPSSNSSGGV